jgi:hypothetical protein
VDFIPAWMARPQEGLKAVGNTWQKLARVAAVEPNAFAEFVLRDKRGGKIRQAPMHRDWHRMADTYSRLVIWASREAGKTEQMSIARTLWLLGQNPMLRVALVSNTQDQASKILQAIGRYIEQSEPLHNVFPLLRRSPRKGDVWHSTALTVDRPSIVKEPSLQAFGVHGNVTGSRLDLLILDDVLDPENCRTPAMRKDLIDWYHATLAGCLVEGARVLCIGTAYHPEDLMHFLAANSAVWKSSRFPIVDEETGALAWPEVWSAARLDAKRTEVGSLEFARQMLCQARDDATARFRREWVNTALRAGIGRSIAYKLPPRLPAGFSVYTGVDLGVKPEATADLTAITTILVHSDGRREILEVLAGNWAGPDIVGRIADVQGRYGSVVMVEDNASQAYLIQFLRDQTSIPVRSFTTTARKKYSSEFGIESLAVEMESGKWIIPSNDGRTALTAQMQALVQEMLYYDPMAHTGDRLMSLWLAREAARAGQGAFTASSSPFSLTDR